jgi:hypothetical protein
MSRIYLINVGANKEHYSVARSAKFKDGSFQFVTFPRDPDDSTGQRYPDRMKPFVREKSRHTHLDPDLENLTYGDFLGNPRAKALKNAGVGDVLLFWGLLCNHAGKNRNNFGDGWSGFEEGQESLGWYLLGAMRIAHVMYYPQRVKDIPQKYQYRARLNAHVNKRKGSVDEKDNVVFIADRARSAIFKYAVDLGVRSRNGLIYKAFRASDGTPISLKGWQSYLRSCRCIFDLNPETSDRDTVRRATLVDNSIREHGNAFSLLQSAASS